MRKNVFNICIDLASTFVRLNFIKDDKLDHIVFSLTLNKYYRERLICTTLDLEDGKEENLNDNIYQQE